MKRLTLALLAAFTLPAASVFAAPAGFSIEQVLGYPYPLHLTSNPATKTIAYVLDERGVRNIFVADAPTYKPRMVTHYTSDDGQEITGVQISRDGKYVVYARGGDHDSNWPVSFPPDPARSPIAPQMQVWSVALQGSAQPAALGDGDSPAISPDNHRVAFLAADQSVMWAPIDTAGKAQKLFFDEGQDSDLRWSPDGSRLAFVSTRTDHSFIGVYANDSTPLLFLSPSTNQDIEPRWSPDGRRIAYLRLPGQGGPPMPDFAWTSSALPWGVWVANARTGAASHVWQSGNTLRADFPVDFDPSLRWNANRLTFVSSADGWPHIYGVSPSGGPARLLTPGAFWVEDTAVSADGRTMFYSANRGSTAGDFDRRHLFAVDVASGRTKELTRGATSEWAPVAIDGSQLALIQAGAKQPPLVSVVSTGGGTARAIDRDRLPADFPLSQLVIPKSVTFRAADGHISHGQIFESSGGPARKPAVIFVHGGPPRQMLTTWHNMDYYTNGYAVNQYLATHGFVVLSINYRLSIGYGFDYAAPPHWGPTGASEYSDVLGGNAYLRGLSHVDPKRIGIWGGSYGGYLTALALARNSDVFCTGVDWHGVHDWSTAEDLPNPPPGYEHNDMQKERRIAWFSSPDAYVPKWRSPVLLVQGDDDHNVRFHQTVDLARRLDLAHVPYSELVIPNEIHGFLRYNTFLQTDTATVDYLTHHLSAGSCR
jgi:dipeptidyl aminopeptidase/acylaminoacyl peptidase